MSKTDNLPHISVAEQVLFYLLAFSCSEQKEARYIRNLHTFAECSYQQMYFWLSQVPSQSVRGAIADLRKKGAISIFHKQGLAQIRATVAGKESFLARFPTFQRFGEDWDEQWRIVILYQVRERGSHASSVYRKLRDLLDQHGFAQLERGVYVSPWPIPHHMNEVLRSTHLNGHVLAFATRELQYGDARELASRLWNLEKTSKDYAKLSKQVGKLLAEFQLKKGLTDREKEIYSTILFQSFQMLSLDIMIPNQLSDVIEEREDVWKTLLSCMQTLI